MIIALQGEIFFKEPTRIAIKCAGVIYEVFISLQTSNQITQSSCDNCFSFHI